MTAQCRTSVWLAVLPMCLLGLVLGLDVVSDWRRWGVLATGVLDEPAHLATAILGLLAVAGPDRLIRHRTVAISAVIGSMAIDIDHLPLYLGLPVAVDHGRPFTHSLLTPVVLLLCWLVSGRGWSVGLGLSIGVLLHFVRDVATGPGVPLLWPVGGNVVLAYQAYVWALVVLAIVATGRIFREARFIDERAPMDGSTGDN